MNWTETIEAFIDTCTAATGEQYRRALDDFAEWYRGSYGELPDPTMLTDEEVREWRGYLSSVRQYAASTVNVRLAAVKGATGYVGNEISTRGVRQVDKPVETLSGRDLGRLVRAVENNRWGPAWMTLRNVALVNLMARAGLRVSEVVGLDIGDVALNDRSGWATIRQGKGLKEREVPLSLQARRALSDYLEARPESNTLALFLSKSLARLSERAIQEMVKGAALRAGIEDATPHTLRHTFATRFLRRGGDLATLRDILGHANLATTSRYVHSDAAQMQEMVEGL